jgi:uncharacterized protein (TIGR02246 family)
MKRVFWGLLVVGGVLGTWPMNGALSRTSAQDSDKPSAQPSADESAIRKADEAYVQAFNRHDAKALADAWSPEAVYLNRTTGDEVVGRAAIAEQFTAYFKQQPEVKMELEAGPIQFISPNVAVEQGNGKTLVPNAEPEVVDYSAVYVRRDGQWLLDRVTDTTKTTAPPSHYDRLKPLEWMIGRWVDSDKGDDVDVETECKWTKNKNFITRSFTVTVGNEFNLSGMQIVGWDASAKQIHSWTFDSDGGFAEAVWTPKGDKWFIRNKGVLGDGRKATMVNIIKKVDDNSFTWQTVERTAGDELLPNVDEVLIVREK